MYFVYVLSSVNKSYIYVGLSSDFERRLSDHNHGYNRTTKPYRPFKVILVEEYESRTEARQREKYLKSGIGKEYLKRLIPNDASEL